MFSKKTYLVNTEGLSLFQKGGTQRYRCGIRSVRSLEGFYGSTFVCVMHTDCRQVRKEEVGVDKTLGY